MNIYLTRTALIASAVVLIAGCGTETSRDSGSAKAPPRPEAAAGLAYDGWAVRMRWDAPKPCPWSPDQVERMLESGAPIPGCVRDAQRWFRDEYPATR